MDFYAEGEPVMSEGLEVEEDSLVIHDDDTEVVQMIKELLEMRIRPSVQEDGGDIKYHGFDEETGVVLLEMQERRPTAPRACIVPHLPSRLRSPQGSCSGCPSSSVTLKSGIENMLMHYIPEVTEVRNFIDEDDEDEDGMRVPSAKDLGSA